MKGFFSSNRHHLISQVKTAIPTQDPVSNPSTLDVWRDPVWQSLGVITGTALAVIAILISLRQWQRKSLAYEIVAKENIVRVADNSIGSELQISYQGKPVKDLHLITVKFTNLGNAEIKPEDYVRQISLSFGEKSEILGSKIIEQEPSNLGVKINHDKIQEMLLIDPVLLNNKDCFVIQALVTGFQKVSPNGRIAGIKKIREVATSKFDSETLLILLSLTSTIVGTFASLFTTNIALFVKSENIAFTIAFATVLLSVIISFFVIQLPTYKTKKK